MRSLVDLLGEADDLLSVSDGTPGEQVAVIEYLLAICYASKTCPTSEDQWQSWVAERRPLTDAADWLTAESDADWDLFDPVRPLGQNSLLAPFLEEHGTGPAQLVIERVGDYNQFFDHHHLADPKGQIPAAEAFRAMLTQHVYGPSGRARISGKATLGPAITNLGTARLGGRIRVVALGSTLGETLRLNLAPPGDSYGSLNLSWTTGDFERRGFHAKPAGRPVRGPADLHSYLGRSILLRPLESSDGRSALVDRVLIGAGELLELELETHLQDAVLIKTRDETLKPLWPSATRALWLDAHALYAGVTKKREGLFGRLAALPRSQDPIRLWAVGLLTNKSSPVAWIQGHYPFAPGLERKLHEASDRGSQIAEYVARSLDKAAYAAWEITYPNPKPADKPSQLARFDARGEHWENTAEPFQILLEGTMAIDPDDPADGAQLRDLVDEYAATVATAAVGFLTKRLDSLPRNSQGSKTRARALRRLMDELSASGAPPEIRAAVRQEDPE